MKSNFDETNLILFDKIFNTDNFEIFPKLGEYYKENPDLMESIFSSFLMELYDLSNSVVKAFVNERDTFIYRKVYGVFDNGYINSFSSVGREVNMTGVRIIQIIKYCNRNLINLFIDKYESIRNGSLGDRIFIEELGLPNIVYCKLKRIGINYLNEIDFESLQKVNGFGEKTFDKIKKSIVRVRTTNSHK